MSGALALIAGLFVTSCHDDDVYENINVIDQKTQGFQKAFKEAFGSINPNQTWGFKQTNPEITVVASSQAQVPETDLNAKMDYQSWQLDTTTPTRAVFEGYWDGVHICDWQDKLTFSLPANYVTVGQNTQIKSGSVYYVPKDFNGTINFDNFNGDLYVAGKVTGFNGNPGTLNLYIFDTGTWSKGFTTGTINIYNNGNLVLGGYDLQNSNVQAIYNGGYFSLGTSNSGLNTSNSVKLYSTGIVELTGTGTMDYKFVTDIYGKLKVNGNIKIQNGTSKYICNIEATGKVENVDGPLIVSTLIANELSFDGNPIYLTHGGHIKVATTINMPNGNCHVYAVQGSNALVETQNFHFENKGDLVHSFSQNVYFQVSGYIELSGCYINNDGNYHKYIMPNDLDKLLGNTADELDKVAGRLNAGSASGSPACGDAWRLGPVIEHKTRYSITTKRIEQGRIFCEDLGNFSNRDDLDYNDVVFDARIFERTYKTIIETYEDEKLTDTKEEIKGQEYFAEIDLLAAGGTLNLTVAGQEVHELFGVGVTTMVNTHDKGSVNVGGANTVKRETVRMINPHYRSERDACTPTDNFKDERSEADKESDQYFFRGYNKILDIPITVLYDNVSALKLEAEIGKAPHKILVDIGTLWPSERCSIEKAYPKFREYVRGDAKDFWSDGGIGDYLCEPENVFNTGVVGDKTETITENSITLNVLWKSETEEGYDISRPLYFTNKDQLKNQGIKEGDRLRFDGSINEGVNEWAIFLSDGNSNRLHSDTSSPVNKNGYAEVTLTKDMVEKLLNNRDNAAMVISGYGVTLTRVSLIKK